MRFTLAWLHRHLETTASCAEIAARLTALGLEVEEVVDHGAALADFQVAAILATRPHPNADRLKLCQVDLGDKAVEVVCGAPNARAGIKVVYAREGCVIPATGAALKASKIRGVVSNGMLCSARELQLGEEQDGIIELPASAAIGAPAAAALGADDPIITIKLTPNRPDCAGVRGIARDLAAAGLGTLRPLPSATVPGAGDSPLAQLETPACPLFVTRLIRGVRNGPSPAWLQQQLRAVGLRPISALVDITNFFCLDQARPLHVFDAARLAGPLVVRGARAGETLLALNEKTYVLDSDMVVIADDRGVRSLGGVMGGLDSGVTDQTQDVLLEVALFDPVRTAQTARALQLGSDASYRFERGLDPAAALAAEAAATALILELCGGTAAAPAIAGAVPDHYRQYPLRRDRVANLGGVSLPAADQELILTRLGFALSPQADGYLVVPPSWRPDIQGEADLVEEILRVHGYAAVPTTPLPRPPHLPSPALSPAQQRLPRLRRLLAGRGLTELVTWSFMDRDLAVATGPAPPALTLRNPISADLAQLRPSIVGNLLQIARDNQHRGTPDVGLFEIGPVFTAPTPGGQEMAACTLRAGLLLPRHWQSGAGQPVDAYAAKADAFAILAACGVNPERLKLSTADLPPHLHPGQAAVMLQGRTVLGYAGAVHPALLARLDLAGPAAVVEIFLDRLPLPKNTGPARPAPDLPELMPLVRDFAFVMPHQVPVGDLLAALRAAAPEFVTEISVFDVYRGPHVPADHQSVAISIRLQPRQQAMDDTTLTALTAAITKAAAALGAVLRA